MIKPHSGIGHNSKCKSALSSTPSNLAPKKDDFSPDSETVWVLTFKYRISWICAFWRGHVGAAAGWCRRLPSQGASQGAAVRVACAFWSCPSGTAAGCWLLQSAANRVLCSATAGCFFRSECCVRAGTRCCFTVLLRESRVHFGAG